MNFLNLRYFLTLSEDLNFSRSAKRLYISQQSLSVHIQKLEKECGIQLFHRDSPLRLTNAGEEFAKSARVILKEKESLEKKLYDLRDFQQGNVVVGVPVSRGTILLPKVLSLFHQEFPEVKVHLAEGTTNEIHQELMMGKTDLTVGFQMEESDRIESHRLYMETNKIVVPNSFLDAMPNQEELRASREPIPLSTFAGFPFVGLHESTLTGTLLHMIAHEEKFTPNVVMSSRNLLTMLSLCCTGIGLCICPDSFLIDTNSLVSQSVLQKVTTFRMKSNYGRHWIVANRLKNKYHSQPEKRLLRIIKDTYEETFLDP